MIERTMTGPGRVNEYLHFSPAQNMLYSAGKYSSAWQCARSHVSFVLKSITTGGISMARDAKNMPFPRPTSYQNSDSTGQDNGSNNKSDTPLRIENMLLAEFNYASITAYQAMEDRARISSFYYLLLGVLASGLAAIYQLSGGTHNVPLFLVVTLLVIGALISICFFVTLIRLRQAYKESLISMNVTKEFYIKEFKQQIPAIEHAFRWRLETIPKGERIGSVTFMIASLNALIGSLCLAGAVFIGTEQLFTELGASILAGMVFVIAILLHIFYYRRALSKRSEAEVIHEEAVEIGVVLPKTT
jgi:hypothetical protein